MIKQFPQIPTVPTDGLFSRATGTPGHFGTTPRANLEMPSKHESRQPATTVLLLLYHTATTEHALDFGRT